MVLLLVSSWVSLASLPRFFRLPCCAGEAVGVALVWCWFRVVAILGSLALLTLCSRCQWHVVFDRISQIGLRTN